ncbi:UDP-glucose 4-epimerase [compost metagenome]
MKTLVLGGQGFIGSHVVDQLISRGHEVRVYARRAPEFATSVEWVCGDFLDTSSLSKALQGIEVVVHAVSSTVPSTSAMDPLSDIQSNLVGTVALLQLMQRMDVGRLVFLSSGGTVYGNPSTSPVSEGHPLNPISSYGAVKVAIEKFIGVAQQSWGLRPVIIRPSNPFGVRQGRSGIQGLISTVLNNIIHQEPTKIYGDGASIRDYIYVEDLARLVVSAVDRDVCGVFNAGSGFGYSVNQIIDVVEKVTGEVVLTTKLESRGFDVREVVLECALAKKVFGWESTTALDVGIGYQYDWLKNLKL